MLLAYLPFSILLLNFIEDAFCECVLRRYSSILYRITLKSMQMKCTLNLQTLLCILMQHPPEISVTGVMQVWQVLGDSST